MYDVNLVYKLSQEEGLNDREISEVIGCSRVTITRIRKRECIPICNRNNKKDKKYVCASCGKEVYIRRCEARSYLCPDCISRK